MGLLTGSSRTPGAGCGAWRGKGVLVPTMLCLYLVKDTTCWDSTHPQPRATLTLSS